MRSHRDEIDLSAELRALRPTPRVEFTDALDSRAEAGFPRAIRREPRPNGRIGRRLAGLGRVPERLRALPRRRLLAPAGAAATAAIVVATALIVSSEGGTTGDTTRVLRSAGAPAGDSSGDTTRVLRSAGAPAGDSSGVQYSEAPPVKSGSSASAGHAEIAPTAGRATAVPGPYASGVAHRDVERSAQMVLGTDASGVRSAAAKVFEAVHAYHGIVLRSSISDGRDGRAGATFSLLIPSGRLSDAMAAFSGIADVRSRHESSLDVTAPTIGLRERLQDARAEVESLLAAIAGAETEAEREAAEAKLGSARRRVATLRSRFASLRRRTHLSSILLRIETGGAHGATGTGWGIDDALNDAGHILAVASGVVLVGLAILVPPLLIALLAWLAHRGWLRWRRERALD